MIDKKNAEESLTIHKPVLVSEVNKLFNEIAPLKIQDNFKNKAKVIDATLGGGGHASEFVKKGAYVLGIDADEKMVKIAGENLRKTVDKYFACPTGDYDNFFKIIHGNFASIDTIAKENKVDNADLILFDLGISSYHYLFKERGFSFQEVDSPLDMRLTNDIGVKGSDLLNALPLNALKELFLQTMSYADSLKLAKSIIEKRKGKKILSVGDFSDIINSSLKRSKSYLNKKKIRLETLPFLALRIAVNYEMENLNLALKKSWSLLKTGGIIVVISFHSGEDRVVKHYFSMLLNKKLAEDRIGLIRPDEKEKAENVRSRSAKMRALKKIR